MKQFGKWILTAALFSLATAQAAPRPYDRCSGEFPGGIFSEEAQRFVVTADGAYLSLHLDGPHRHDDFTWRNAEVRETDARTYTVTPVFSDDTFADLKIDLAQCDPAFHADDGKEVSCPAEITTNVSGKTHTVSLGCTVNWRDYPPPTNPGTCHTHCI